MLKEIVIFGAGLVAGALGASYAIGWMEGEASCEGIVIEEERNSREDSAAEVHQSA